MITVSNLCKSFGGLEVLKGVNVEIDKGDVICVIGPSGSGKSVLIRSINGLERPDSGELTVNGIDMMAKKVDTRKLASEVAMVFQGYNLYPHKTVLENVTFAPIKVLKVPKAEAEEAGRAYLERVGLSSKLDKYPDQLSGGQQQRVALARTLTQSPHIILADEPVAALDPVTAKQVMQDFVHINQELGISILLNIHHVELALEYADRIIGIRAGKIVYDGPSNQVDQAVLDSIYGEDTGTEASV